MAENLLLLERVGKPRAKEIFGSLFKMVAPHQRTQLRWLIYNMRELRARGGLRNARAFFVSGTREIVGNEVWCKWIQDLHLQSLAFRFEEEAMDRHLDKEIESMCETLYQSQEFSDVPNDFLCPISWQIMVEPVILVDSGQTYDRENIMQWLDTKKTDPMTNVPVHVGLLVPNHSLRRMITEYLQSKTSSDPSAPKRKHEQPVDVSPRPIQRRRCDSSPNHSSAVPEIVMPENDIDDGDFITNLPSNCGEDEGHEFFGEEEAQQSMRQGGRVTCCIPDTTMDQYVGDAVDHFLLPVDSSSV